MTPIPVWPGEFVSLGETRVFVRTAPATSAATDTTAEPVVCVHGFCQSSAYWAPTLDRLAETGVAGIAVDNRGNTAVGMTTPLSRG